MQNEPQKSAQKQIALFKYGIIAPILYDTSQRQTKYFKMMADKTYDVPTMGRKKYNWKTFKSWLRMYRQAGFDGLKPKLRSDRGSSRRIDSRLETVITQKLQTMPTITNSFLYRTLVNEGHIQNASPCEETVRLFVINNKLRPEHDKIIPRKKFEKPHINDLWLADFMHVSGYLIGNKRKKIILCGIIDDYSRLLVGSQWSFQENIEAIERTLKRGIQTYGAPKIFYCDNGAAFSCQHLQLICARIGIALIHSKPYDSPSRGKIERFWRTVRDNFLPLLPADKSYSLDQFNQLFQQWLEQSYHRKLHHGIMQTPLDRFVDDMNNTAIRKINDNELDLIFYRTYKRKVKNDATISIETNLFEVPAKYIGSFIEIRHPLGSPLDLWIFEHERPIVKIKFVDVKFNSNSPQSGIRFSN